jgi:hypothetical protein
MVEGNPRPLPKARKAENAAEGFKWIEFEEMGYRDQVLTSTGLSGGFL